MQRQLADRIIVMNNARIAQDGSARELYEAPADRFVVNFMDEASILPVTIAAVDGDTARVSSPFSTDAAVGIALTPSGLALLPVAGGREGIKAGLRPPRRCWRTIRPISPPICNRARSP